MHREIRRASLLFCALWAGVVSVDVSAMAREFIAEQGWTDVWITDIYRACPKGSNIAIAKGAEPDTGAPWDTVEAGGFKVHVPQNRKYENDIPRIVRFSTSEGYRVGAANETDD